MSSPPPSFSHGFLFREGVSIEGGYRWWSLRHPQIKSFYSLTCSIDHAFFEAKRRRPLVSLCLTVGLFSLGVLSLLRRVHGEEEKEPWKKKARRVYFIISLRSRATDLSSFYCNFTFEVVYFCNGILERLILFFFFFEREGLGWIKNNINFNADCIEVWKLNLNSL